MPTPAALDNFFYAFTTLMLATGEIKRDEYVSVESLDRALSAYVRNVVEELDE
jgi:hypothetical protein